MELCTLSHIVAIAEAIAERSGLALKSLSEEGFQDLVDNIFEEIDMFSIWKKSG